MLAAALLASSLLAAWAIPPIPTVPINGLNMPVVGSGSCCGSYNITSWLAEGGRHIDTSCDYGSRACPFPLPAPPLSFSHTPVCT